MAASQAKLHGLNPDDVIVKIKPREGERILRTEDIISYISENGESIALVLFPGVHWITGQVFDMQAISQAAHSRVNIIIFDLSDHL